MDCPVVDQHRYQSASATETLSSGASGRVSEEITPEDLDLRNALMKLKGKYRILLVLHYQNGYSLEEISEIMGISERLVKSRMHQARQELKKLLGGDDYEA